MKTIKLDLQIESQSKHIPSKTDFQRWIELALADHASGTLCIRIIDKEESQQLNKEYRHRDHPTNVLTFDYQDDDELIGDIAICAPVVEDEAKKYEIPLTEHWALMTIHGCLHLLGYTHDDDKNAEIMESKERELLRACLA